MSIDLKNCTRIGFVFDHTEFKQNTIQKWLGKSKLFAPCLYRYNTSEDKFITVTVMEEVLDIKEIEKKDIPSVEQISPPFMEHPQTLHVENFAFIYTFDLTRVVSVYTPPNYSPVDLLMSQSTFIDHILKEVYPKLHIQYRVPIKDLTWKVITPIDQV